MLHKSKTPVDRFIAGDTQIPDTLLSLFLESLFPKKRYLKSIEDTFNREEQAVSRKLCKTRPNQTKIYYYKYNSPQYDHSYRRQSLYQDFASKRAPPKDDKSFRSRLPPISVMIFMSIYIIFLIVYILFAVGGR